MGELEWGPGWVESRVEEALAQEPLFAPMGVGREVPPEYFDRFAGVLPDSVLHIWRRFGFEGFAQGRWWITDPLWWQPVVEAWLDGVDLPFPPQQWFCFKRSAMGVIHLWGERSGPALEIDPLYGDLFPDSSTALKATDPVMRERMGAIRLTSPVKDADVDEASGRLLVDVAIDRLGVLDAEQVYGFVPALCFTGRVDASLLSMHDAQAHLTLLAQSSGRTLQSDFMGLWQSELDQALTNLGLTSPDTRLLP